MKYSTAQSSRLGNRSNNEDRCAIFTREPYVLLVLADGMGGHKAGEVAAQTTVDTFKTVFNNFKLPINNAHSFLQQLLYLAHSAIQDRCRQQVDIPRTTCVCCLINDTQAIWAHSGDSRLYLLREGCIQQRTRDHSYVEEMLHKQTVSEQEAAAHPMRNYVTASLGGSNKRPHINVSEVTTLQTNDTILLCSDGLWSGVDEKNMLSILQTEPMQHNFEQALDQLTDLADNNSYPHSDNTTGILINIRDCTSPADIANSVTIPEPKDNNDPMQQAINDIETAYFLYKNELK